MGERGFHHSEALVEREPSRTGMPGQYLVLLDRRIKAEPKRGMSGHGHFRVPRPTDNILTCGGFSDHVITSGVLRPKS
jgi:hypothetical protein